MLYGNLIYNEVLDDDYLDNINEIPNTLYNMLRILPSNPLNSNSIIDNVLNESLNDKPKYKKVISNEDIEKYLIISKYDVNDEELLNTSCPIFHINFEDKDDIIKLPCKHCFNPEAINKWLREEKNECPVCRYEFKYQEIVNNENIINIEDEESNINNNLANSLIRSYSLPQNDINWNSNIGIIRPHNISLISTIMNEIIEQEERNEFQNTLLNIINEEINH
jgi:hypothetical protein